MTQKNSSLPRIGVGVVVLKDRKILIGKRSGNAETGDGLYALPGGYLEFGETFKECGER